MTFAKGKMEDAGKKMQYKGDDTEMRKCKSDVKMEEKKREIGRLAKAL